MSGSGPKRHRGAAMKCSLPRVERESHNHRKSVADDLEADIQKPTAFAVIRSSTNSKLIGCSIGTIRLRTARDPIYIICSRLQERSRICAAGNDCVQNLMRQFALSAFGLNP